MTTVYDSGCTRNYTVNTVLPSLIRGFQVKQIYPLYDNATYLNNSCIYDKTENYFHQKLTLQVRNSKLRMN